MQEAFALEYWSDSSSFVGHLPEIPGGFSQAETLSEPEERIRHAHELVVDDQRSEPRPGADTREILLEA